MGQAYTPSLLVTPNTRVTKQRELPLAGRVLVRPGDQVQALSPVLAAEIPGELEIVRIADRLGVDPEDVAEIVPLPPGTVVREGDLLCERRSFFGLLRARVSSPVGGVVEFFTPGNAHLGIRRPPTQLEVNAYIDGTVVAIEEGKSVTLETDAAVIQGIFGVGGERHGIIRALAVSPDEVITAAKVPQLGELSGGVLVGGASFTADALEEAAKLGASAVVTGSIESADLRRFTGRDISVSVTGDEDVPLTLIVTEGFGHLPLSSRAYELAQSLEGRRASVNGATQVRAGAMRPEIVVPREVSGGAGAEMEDAVLRPGTRIRCIRVPYFGLTGTVVELPHNPEAVASGARVRVLRARLDGSGETVTIPRANVELIA